MAVIAPTRREEFPNGSRVELYHGDCFTVLEQLEEGRFHAIITDPPYGVLEYTPEQVDKLRAGRGGVWRIPPSFDGHRRRPLPRFTVLSEEDLDALEAFFEAWARAALRVLRPGGHLVLASNTLLEDVVFRAVRRAGFEKRGVLHRPVSTLRGGDRPKGAESVFPDVSVSPRNRIEPWGLFRKPFEGTVRENLERWGTGGLRRISKRSPFTDLLADLPLDSSRTPRDERELADHPSLKPQQLLRYLVWAALPVGEGEILDPFMGSGAHIAAAAALGYDAVGIEIDGKYFELARRSIPLLASLPRRVNGSMTGASTEGPVIPDGDEEQPLRLFR
ncbi:MAG TPA: DNA methyltransferase [Longimicrobiales bacterium]